MQKDRNRKKEERSNEEITIDISTPWVRTHREKLKINFEFNHSTKNKERKVSELLLQISTSLSAFLPNSKSSVFRWSVKQLSLASKSSNWWNHSCEKKLTSSLYNNNQRSKFESLRPKNIHLKSNAKHLVCCCTYHTNIDYTYTQTLLILHEKDVLLHNNDLLMSTILCDSKSLGLCSNCKTFSNIGKLEIPSFKLFLKKMLIVV